MKERECKCNRTLVEAFEQKGLNQHHCQFVCHNHNVPPEPAHKTNCQTLGFDKDSDDQQLERTVCSIDHQGIDWHQSISNLVYRNPSIPLNLGSRNMNFR